MASETNLSSFQPERDIAPPLPRLDCLPDEVIQAILQQLDALSLASISGVSRHFNEIANEHLIWKDLTIQDFTFWDDSHQFPQRTADLSFRDWKQLYIVRHTANIATHRGIRLMVDEPLGRLAKADKILSHGYGIKDALLKLIDEAPSTDCELAQRYWAQLVLSSLNRSIALHQWTRIRYRSDIANPTETALAALDMFTLGPSATGDIADTFRRLDLIVAAVRTTHPAILTHTPRDRATLIADVLRTNNWVGITEGRDYYSLEHQFLGLALRSPHRNSLPLISAVIYCYVARQFGLRAQPCSYPMHVHSVVQPGDPTIDLDGSPLPPNHVANLRREPDFSDLDADADPPSLLTHLYIDVFNTSEPISLPSLLQQLAFTAPNATRAQRATYLLPASPRSLLIRSAHNIIRSVQATPFNNGNANATNANATNPTTTTIDPIPINIYDAAYASLFALTLFPSSPQGLASGLRDLRQHFAHHFPEDVRNYTEFILPLTTTGGAGGGGMGPSFGGATDPLLTLIRKEDVTPKVPKRRSDLTSPSAETELELKPWMTTDEAMRISSRSPTSDPHNNSSKKQEVIYRIGQPFRHKRQGYTAVITGWDTHCAMDQRWIVGNGVDRLPGGRGQPFYNVFVNDTSTRYVAQENIQLLTPEEFTAEDARRSFGVEVGRWFRRFDDGRGKVLQRGSYFTIPEGAIEGGGEAVERGVRERMKKEDKADRK